MRPIVGKLSHPHIIQILDAMVAEFRREAIERRVKSAARLVDPDGIPAISPAEFRRR